MKIHTQTRRKGQARVLASVLALVLAVGLVFAAPAGLGVAYAEPDSSSSESTVDPGDSSTTGGSSDSNSDSAAQPETTPGDGQGAAHTNSLTVNFTSGWEAENSGVDLKAENALVDVYKIADAVRNSSYNVYDYVVGKDSIFFETLNDYVTADANKNDWTVTPTQDGSLCFRYTPVAGASVTENAWKELIQPLAKQIWPATGERPVVESVTPETLTVGQAATLPDGLYLVTVHAEGLPDPVRTTDTEDYDLVTLAYTANQLYTFPLELVALPALAGVNQTDTTIAGYTENASIYMKGSYKPRTADLAITKTVADYNGAATFVFQVAVTDQNNVSVAGFPKQYTLSVGDLDGATTKPVAQLLGKIPAGSNVTVTEVYSGVNYDTAAPVVIEGIGAGAIDYIAYNGEVGRFGEDNTEIATLIPAAFTNTGNNTANGGGSVVNHFEPTADNTWWNWIQRIWDAATNAWREIDHGSVDRTSN